MKMDRLKILIGLWISLLAVLPHIAFAQSPAAMLIPRGSAWKYHNLNQDLGTAWLTANYDDSPATGWAGPAPGPFGYNPDAPQFITTVINIAPDNSVGGSRYPTIYFRRSINVSQASAYEGMTLRIMRDDAAIVYLNGQFLMSTPGADASLPHSDFCCAVSGGVGGVDEYTYFEYPVRPSLLLEGTNIFAVEVRQQSATSSDLTFDMEVEGIIDLQPPYVASRDPLAGSVVLSLDLITVTFDSDVTGVGASDLLINSQPATNLLAISPREYQFSFPTPQTGLVQVAWSPTHGITDTSPLHNAFDGSSGWTYTYEPDLTPPNTVLISEFLANNNTGIRDEDGSRSDWIEILNPHDVVVNLNGFYLTDESTNLTKWRFPAVVIQPHQYLLIWASGKDRRNPSKPLHTNFKLDHEGEYLGLINSITNIISEFAPAFLAQQPDISYGRDAVDPNIAGYFLTPTPGAQNAVGGPGFMDDPVLSLESGVYTNDSLSLTITGPAGGTIRFTTDGSNPTNTSPIYAGPIGIAGNTTVKVRVYPNSGSLFPSRVIAGTYVLLDSSARDFNSNLPLLVLDCNVTIPGEVPPGAARGKGRFVVFDTIGGRSALHNAPAFQGLAEFELVGQTALGFPKKPYRIEIQDELGRDREVSVLGLPADADWQLRNPWDKSLMNDYLAYELFEQMGHYSCRRKYVEVFVHQGAGKLTAADYHGIELLLEKIEVDRNRVDIRKLSPSITAEPEISGGYIFKKDKNSAGDLDFSTAGAGGFPGIALKFHEPKPRELIGTVAGTNQQKYLVNFLNQMEKSLYAQNWLTATGTNHYSNYLDVDLFVDQFWIVEFPKAIDGYRLSAFFSKDRNGKIKPEPIWDWKLGWGNANYLDGGHYRGWYWNQTGSAEQPWAKRLITGSTGNTGIGDPDFCQKIADRWAVLRTNLFNGYRMIAHIDEIAAMLSEAANRPAPLGDFTKPAFARLGTAQWPEPNGVPAWDVDYVNPLTYSAIISEVKKWVLGRFQWIDGQFILPPVFSPNGGMVSNGTMVTLSVPFDATNYYTLDGTDPRLPGGDVAPGALIYTGPITINGNVRIFARARKANNLSFQNTWSGPSVQTFFTTVSPLRITEIMYHPDGNENLEFIEVQNVGGTALNVNHFSLSGGVQFDFPSVTLADGQYAVIVKDVDAFQARYGTEILILGTYTDSLSNGGERLVLSGPIKEPILDFSYSDTWHLATDGPGFSLVFMDPTNAPASNWGLASSWRASSSIGGSPGATDAPPPPRPAIVVNEALSYCSPAADVIELHNPTGDPVNVGGWFLTDDLDAPKKFMLPNRTISVNAFATLTSDDFGGAFRLDSKGDAVYLFSGDGVNLTGYAHGFTFGAAEPGVTFGRHVTSSGEEHFVAQKSSTLGAVNSGPLVGPVVISEIMYHPVDGFIGTNALDNTFDEFIELRNVTGTNVALYDLNHPANTWRLQDAVTFSFPGGVSLAPNDFLLVVSFDPLSNPSVLTSFRQHHGVPMTVPIVGPWTGALNNDGARLELLKPRAPEPDTSVEYVLVERIDFKPAAPWPMGVDGFGFSLQRIVPTSYGNDPTNWVSRVPTPGADHISGGTPPVILSQPADQVLRVASNVTFTVTAAPGDVRYQWRFMNLNLQNATNSTLSFSSLQLSNAGLYNVFVFNNAGYALGTNFALRVLPGFLKQPENVNTVEGATTNFTVVASGTGTLRYRWFFNGVPISENVNRTATNSVLVITNVQPSHEGSYFCRFMDDVDTVSSAAATLAVIARPVISQQPITVTTVEGGTAVFSTASIGTPPLSVRWRTNGFSFSNTLPNAIIIRNATNSTLILTNVALSFSNYAISVVFTNLAGQSLPSSNARLYVLPDSDHDGLPDDWESTHVGFDAHNPNDGAFDSDGDGMSNAAEYTAGTDYLDPSSYLKVQFVGNSTALLEVSAVSNRTYTVQYKDDLFSGVGWKKLADVLQRNISRSEIIRDDAARTNRFYRLVIPIQP